MFTDSYLNLLILQYRELPKAEQTITALAAKFEELYNVLIQFEQEFDVDTARGVQLDILGKIVGISRSVPLVIPKNYFGFDDNSASFPMGDKFLTVVTYPFKDKFEPDYTDAQLNDFDYRFFIKSKIIKNNSTMKMIDEDNKKSLQDAIDFLFDSLAYVNDNQDMTVTIYVDSTFDLSKLPYITQLDLIPRPQTVGIKQFISYNEGNTFGFSDNPNSKGFADKFDTSQAGGVFANKII